MKCNLTAPTAEAVGAVNHDLISSTSTPLSGQARSVSVAEPHGQTADTVRLVSY